MNEDSTLLDAPVAPLPVVTEETEAFWRGGEQGRLLIARCGECGLYIHPPAPSCRRCLSMQVAPEPVSGRAQVASFTINYQPWTPGMIVPFVIAVVELAEQHDVRLTTNIVETRLDDVRIGLDVEVIFRQREDVWLPLFRPVAQS